MNMWKVYRQTEDYQYAIVESPWDFSEQKRFKLEINSIK